MERGPFTHLLSWLLFAVGLAVAISALSLPRQPYVGVALQGNRVAAVADDGPGAYADLRPGDHIRKADVPVGTLRARRPLAEAEPGAPMELLRIRGDREDRVVIVPRPLPEEERRLRGALLAVACGFLLLGGWVWSERRDRLTRTFLLICLAFAWMLTPLPHTRSTLLNLGHEFVLMAASVFLPALFVHFFALFPESRQARGRLATSVAFAYAVSTLLVLGALATLALELAVHPAAELTLDIVQPAAALWFACGLLFALLVFARSYWRARDADTRRRLRVVLVGTALGVAPLAALIVFRNLSPATVVPGERWALALTLLVPASFAWATAVHRIFDFGVAIRSGVVVLVLAAAGIIAYVGSEWLAAGWWPDLGPAVAGGSIAFVALAAAIVGPAAPWLRELGEEPVAPHAAARASSAGNDPVRAAPDADLVLGDACERLVAFLGLDACTAFVFENGVLRRAGGVGASHATLARHLRADAFAPGPPIAVEDLNLEPAERAALESANVRWALPVGTRSVRALLLLGARLSGAWFGTRETRDLGRFAHDVEIALENARLRAAASSHGIIDRELREAGEIQSQFLPKRLPAYATVDCAAAALACEAVGGDYYDFIERPDRAFTLAVGDARGHGVPAALTLAGVQARFRQEARGDARPAAILSALNHELARLEHPENFVCLLCARFDTRAGLLRFANAGLTPPLVRRRDGAFEEFTDAGILLGVSDAAIYPDVELRLEAGDVAVVYTDGLSEARRGDAEFGVDGIRAVLDLHAHRRSADIVRELLRAVRAWASGPLDDITLVVLKQLTSGAGAPYAGARETPQVETVHRRYRR